MSKEIDKNDPLPPGLRTLFDRVATHFPGHTMQRVRHPDGRYRYSYVSPGMRETFGLDPEGILGQREVTHDWIHADDRATFVHALEHSAKTLETFDQEVRITADDGRLKWVRSIGYPRRLRDGSVVWDGIAVDVTERREAADMVQRALRIAKEAETSQARMVGDIRGDLRLPLSGIKEMVDALAERVFPQEVAAEIATLQRAIFSLMVLVGVNDGIPEAAESGRSAAAVSPLLARLSPRQREVLALLRQGLTNRDIAGRLKIEEGTVKLHVAAVLKRLGVRNRTAATLST